MSICLATVVPRYKTVALHCIRQIVNRFDHVKGKCWVSLPKVFKPSKKAEVQAATAGK
jgi:hypothetical protein